MPAVSSGLPLRLSRSAGNRCLTGAPDSLLINPALSTDHKPAMCSDKSSLRSAERRESKKSSSGPENKGAINNKVLITRPVPPRSGNTNTSTGKVPPLLVWQRVNPTTGISARSAWLMSKAPLLGRSRQNRSSRPVFSKSLTVKLVSFVKRGLTASIICEALSNNTLFSAINAMASAAAGLCGMSSMALMMLARDWKSMRSELESPKGCTQIRQSMPVGLPPGLITNGAPA